MPRISRPYMRHPPCAVECRCDGNQVYASIGDSCAAIRGESGGVIGFGDTLADALRSLAGEIEREVGCDHLSLPCVHCKARLEFTVLEGQDEAIELDNARHAAKWNYVQGGLGCDVCSRETIEIARLDTRPAYSKPARIIR
jgi:hypothetical protein